MRWLTETRERVRALLFRGRAESETAEEMRFHLEMEAERRVEEEGLDEATARRGAALAFGSVDRYRAEVRDARGLGWLNGTSLDVKLGARMLAKYPGLTLAGGLSLAIAVGLAASWFDFLSDLSKPRLGLPAENGVVAIRNWDQSAAQPERRQLHEFEWWREEVKTVGQLSAVASASFSVTTDDGRFLPVRLARMSGSGFGVLGVRPQLGRVLSEADAAEGGELPVVLGHELWQSLFDGDPAVLGRSLRVGNAAGVVVGVMPEGFGFPVNQQMWVPLRDRARDWERRTGPPILVFGRLAAGATVNRAQAELALLGERWAADYPETHRHLRPQVLQYNEAVGMGALIKLMNAPFILFLIVVCANVATLVFARTATRAGEIAMRSALGASRRRLVLQLVAEALVLTVTAAAVGLFLAHAGLQRAMPLFWEVQQTAPPFWVDNAMSPRTVVYVCVLAVLAALIIGGVPALKATSRRLAPQLSLAGTGRSALRFGRMSTVVIVAQVALCVAFLPVAIMNARDLRPQRDAETQFPAASFLAARIAVQPDAVASGADVAARALAGDARVAAVFGELRQRLAAEPGVVEVAAVNRLPGFNHVTERVVLEADTTKVHEPRVLAVDANYFDVVDAQIVAGRGFGAGDAASDAGMLIVDAEWSRTAFGGRSPIGQRIRFPARRDGEKWYEVVGVVDDFRRAIGPGESVVLFEPLRPGAHGALQFYMRTAGPPVTQVPALHDLITSVDGRVLIEELRPLDDVWRPVERADVYFLIGLNVVAFIILMFALIGIYALMSFTVGQRTREIAIRSALGAHPRRLLASIFSRAMMQIGVGVALGAIVAGIAVADTAADAALIAAVAGSMILVGLGGCALPVARALRIQPTAALKQE